MTPAEFRILLESHDWYYQWSDDPNAFRRGLFHENGIRRILSEQPELQTIYNEVSATMKQSNSVEAK